MKQVTIQRSEDPKPRISALTKPRTRLILALIITAGFLDVIDFSIVQVALPTIQTELVISLAESQWIIGAYGLTLAGFLLLSGRAGDIYGQKKLFVFGIVLFTVASFTGGLAPSLLSLIVSRAIQGIGAAISTATAFAILVTTFPEGKERNRALGIFVSYYQQVSLQARSLEGSSRPRSVGDQSYLLTSQLVPSLLSSPRSS